MQAVRNKMATLKSKLEDAEKAAQEAETDLEETIQAAEEAEERVCYVHLLIILLYTLSYEISAQE